MIHKQIVEFVKKNPKKYTAIELAEKYWPGEGREKRNKVSGIIGRGGVNHLVLKQPRGPQRTKEPTMKKVDVKAYPKGRRKATRAKRLNASRILVIGDLHEPFCREDYRDFCLDMQRQYRTTHTIFIGDIVDNHFASYHETDPDGHGGGHELSLALKNVGKWVEAFPHADVLIGNHDRMILRKAFTGGIPLAWIRDFKDVLDAPYWNFTDEVIYNGVRYIHGEGPSARTRCRRDLISTVQGHRHAEAYTEWVVGETFRIFGMQTGCGVNRRSYAMAYARNYPKQALGVGIVLDDGQLPFNVLMPL